MLFALNCDNNVLFTLVLQFYNYKARNKIVITIYDRFFFSEFGKISTVYTPFKKNKNQSILA